MNFGDVVTVDFGKPLGSEAGFVRPAVIITADAFLRFGPTTVFAVPLTTTPRRFPSHVELEPDSINALAEPSWALVEQVRAVSTERCTSTLGNVGPVVTRQITEILAMITGMH